MKRLPKGNKTAIKQPVGSELLDVSGIWAINNLVSRKLLLRMNTKTPLCPSVLAEGTESKPKYVYNVLNRLAENGLVNKYQDPNNSMRTLYTLSLTGKMLRSEHLE